MADIDEKIQNLILEKQALEEQRKTKTDALQKTIVITSHPFIKRYRQVMIEAFSKELTEIQKDLNTTSDKYARDITSDFEAKISGQLTARKRHYAK